MFSPLSDLELRHYDFVGQVFARWAFANPLHADLHPPARHVQA